MQACWDSDVLVYECGFAAETAWKGSHPESSDPPPFDKAAELLDNRIANGNAIVGATQPPILFLTGKTNFRNSIAKRTPYKERAGKKPFHYRNLIAYIKGCYDYRCVQGMEADDLLALEQTARPGETIICTRDKDLRQVPGWAYSWELGNQPQFGPEEISKLGYIKLSENRKKIKGTGLLFFYSQCLTGDTVDSIPGLPRCGPVNAYEILKESQTEEEMFRSTLAAYQVSFGETAEAELLEQGRLLNMTREFVDGKALLWNPPNVNYKDWIDVNTNEITRTFEI